VSLSECGCVRGGGHLSDKRREVRVLEVLRQDIGGELLRLEDHKHVGIGLVPPDNLCGQRVPNELSSKAYVTVTRDRILLESTAPQMTLNWHKICCDRYLLWLPSYWQ
jgi:hypothetical protein